MAHAELCPVCNGEGKKDGKPCYGCSGKGWIEVQDNGGRYPYWPYPVYPSPLYPPYIVTYATGTLNIETPNWDTTTINPKDNVTPTV